jgi:Concanavalin A-like lectin/glucanases superfamily
MARRFGGSSYAYTSPANSVITPAGPFTLASWFRPLGGFGGPQTIIGIDDAAAGYAILRSMDTACSAVYGGGGVGVATTPPGTADQWGHYAATFASPSHRVAYLNGVPSAPDTTAVTPAALGTLRVGYIYLGAAIQTAYGDIAESGAWGAVLTPEEISALAKGVSPLLIRPSALLAYWPMNGSATVAGTFEEDRWRNKFRLLLDGIINPPQRHPRVFYPWHTSVEAAATPGINFQAAAAFALAATAVLTTGINIAAAASFTVAASTTLSAAPAALAATSAIRIGTSASLALMPALTAATGFRFATAASFLPPTITGAAGFTFSTRATITPGPRETAAGITIDGVDVRERVRMRGVTIHDILNDAPNTASLVVEGAEPSVGQSLRITLNDGTRVLFAGQIQTVDQSFKVRPDVVSWAVTAIDDTARANARRPFGTFVDTSATDIAQDISAQCAPAFSVAGIAPDLPPVSIVFDGSDTFIAALSRLANAIGGYCKVEDGTVYLFQVDTETPPDPIDAAHCFMFDQPIRASVDSSQLRTRVYGKGYGEAVQSDVAAGETLIPIENGSQFPPAGAAIAGTTPEAAQSERLTYTGRELEAGGTLVGPGAAPTTPPAVSLAAGTGVESGLHEYAFVFVTAAGRSLPSPRAAIVVGQVPAPPVPPTAGAAVTGAGPDPGSHRYYAVFRTAAGVTTPGPASNDVTTTGAIAPPALPSPAASGVEGMGLTLGAGYFYQVTFRRASDGAETSPTFAPGSDGGGAVFLHTGNTAFQCIGVRVVTPPPGFAMVLYRTGANESNAPANYREIQTPTLEGPMLDGYMYLVDHNESRKSKTLPASNGTAIASVPLSAIPVYPSAIVTHVDLYREMNHAGPATARMALSVANGTTTAIDATPNSALGAAVPAANTAAANRVNVTWPGAPSGVTNVEIFRTPLGSPQLKLFRSAAGNAGGSTIDSTPDADLTTNAPTGDTSNLTQPSGQVNPGSPFLPVASPAPFRAAGGWVTLAGSQTVRYTGISGQTLIGIPIAGPGAITTAAIYGSPALPTPMLVGVTGLTVPLKKGASIHIWVQRDDLQAQAEQAARAGGDGVIEHVLVDMRRGLDSITARCDAELALFARPLVKVVYATRDLKTKSGKLVTVNLASPRIEEVLTIQDVTITEIDIVPGLAPRFTVTASSVRFSLEDTLRRLIAGGLVVGGST